MSVPDFQTLMLPLLRVLDGGAPMPLAELRERLAAEFRLTPDDLADPLPSGRQTRFGNRVNWAAVYLCEAELLERVRRGVYRIAQRGVETLAQRPDRIDIGYLMRFPEFVAFRDGAGAEETQQTPLGASPRPEPDVTPEESIEAAYLLLRQSIEKLALERVLASPPRFFEEMVVELLVKMGYGGSRADAGRALGRSGDGGLDGIIKEDRLGLDAVYVQAKRWDPSRSVSRPEVQGFVGSLEAERARKGVFITTASFTREAQDYVGRIDKRVVLVDGKRLAGFMFDFEVGVRIKETYELKEIDDDYFSEE